MPVVCNSPIISNVEAGNEVFLMMLKAPEIAFNCRPGNFVQIKIDFPDGGLWGRPFSILNSDGENIRILYKTLGRGTKALSGYQTGRTLSILGPLGNNFSVPDKGSTVLLAGGGIGVPPLYYMATNLLRRGISRTDIHFFNGAGNYDSLVFLDQIAELKINTYAVTEDGTMGIKGLITEGISQFLRAAESAGELKRIMIYSCGPMPMLKAIAGLASHYGVACEMALEALMPCGSGVCMGCVVKIRNENHPDRYSFQRVCHDGPVFKSCEVLWD